MTGVEGPVSRWKSEERMSPGPCPMLLLGHSSSSQGLSESPLSWAQAFPFSCWWSSLFLGECLRA